MKQINTMKNGGIGSLIAKLFGDTFAKAVTATGDTRCAIDKMTKTCSEEVKVTVAETKPAATEDNQVIERRFSAKNTTLSKLDYWT